MRRWPLRTVPGLSLTVLLAVLPAFWTLGAGAARAADARTLPIRICLRKPAPARVRGRDILRCARPVSKVTRNTGFYLLLSVAGANGLQSHALDWAIQRWQPKRHRWATVREQAGDPIDPSWRYVWLFQTRLPAGSYRALVSTDFLAKMATAPRFFFAATFAVH